MGLEIGIKRRLLYLFSALVIVLVAALLFSNAHLQESQKLELARSSHEVFERIFSDAIKTNDVPELSHLLKRSATRSTTFFIYESSSSQLVLPNYLEMQKYLTLSNHANGCLDRLIRVEVDGQKHDLFCRPLKNAESDYNFLLYQLSTPHTMAPIRFIGVALVALVALLITLWLSLSAIMRNQLFEPIDELERYISAQMKESQSQPSAQLSSAPVEILRLRKTFDDLLVRAKNAFELEKKVLESETRHRITRQVAHDIRSPLSALNMLLGFTTELAEEKRLLIKKAIQRINDIANDLLRSNKVIQTGSEKAPGKLALIELEIESLISEKRAEFVDRPGIEVSFKNQSYPVSFAKVESAELRRVLSNLINNSVEAFDNDKGHVSVEVKALSDSIVIVVNDNGKGIPADMIPLLGRPGVSFGKQGESGSGLGLSHAKSFVEKAGGRLEISSREGYGTKVSLQLPRAAMPDWYVESLRLNDEMTVVALDDDQSIHQVWKNLIGSQSAAGAKLVCFTSASEFKTWVAAHEKSVHNVIYLVDYDLRSPNETGLDVIEQIRVTAKSILVTSRFDDDEVLGRCQALGVRQIPKIAAGLIPLRGGRR